MLHLFVETPPMMELSSTEFEQPAFFVVPLAPQENPGSKTASTSCQHKMHFWQAIDPANAASHFVYPPNKPNGWNG